MAVVGGGVHGGYLPSELRRPPPTTLTSKINITRKVRTTPPPIFISTNPSHINPNHLRDLFSLCNHSCHRFPTTDSDPVDLHKLRIALSHSSVLVSVFSRPEVVSNLIGVGGDWFRRVVPVTPSNGQLVGFGRAVSDCGLTASIYDVMRLTGYSFITRYGNWQDDS
ncbi:hypothetical protein CsSME_00028880 [Camellia sinensis var. sinensis]